MMVIFAGIILFFVLGVNCTSHPCTDYSDQKYTISALNAYCYRYISETLIKKDVMSRCKEWNALATPVAIHSDAEYSFVRNIQQQNVTHTGYIKTKQATTNCVQGVSTNMRWDDSTDDSWIVNDNPNKRICPSGQFGCFELTATGNFDDVSCDVFYPSICYFKVPVCSGIIASNASDVCSSHGYCLEDDKCTCFDTYSGSNCENTFTCNAVRQDDSSVCSGKGNCTLQNNCICEDGRYGDHCQYNNLGLCSGANEISHNGYCYRNFGSGRNFDDAENHCRNNWEISQAPHLVSIHDSQTLTFVKSSVMTNRFLLGLRKNTSSSTLKPCPISEGYYWSDGTSDKYARSRGSSVHCDSTTHQCFYADSGYMWNDIDCTDVGFETICRYKIPTCQGIPATSAATVCTGQGICVGNDNCSCFEDYYGANCNFYKCFGEQMDSDDTCSSHGLCIGPQTCICEKGYTGENCNITSCNGIYSTSSSVCNGHGKCEEFDVCNCDWDWGTPETFCNMSYPCQGGSDVYVSDTSTYCYTRVTEDKSYDAHVENCRAWTTGGHMFTIKNAEEMVVLRTLFNDEDPNQQNWFGIQKVPHDPPEPGCPPTNGWAWDDGSDTSFWAATWNSGLYKTICNEVTRCVLFHDCCDGGFPYEFWDAACSVERKSACKVEIYSCGAYESHQKEVCNNNGFCVGGSCVCKGDGYVGNFCEVKYCGGIGSNDTKNVCSGHGDCIDTNLCSCDTGWAGPNCNVTSCNKIWTNDTSRSNEICHGHGTCKSPGKCDCEDYYFGSDCQHTYCNWVKSTDSGSVCAGRGSCYPLNNCSCNSGDYFGDECKKTMCYGLVSDDENVCSGGGKCVDKDVCVCEAGLYSGLICNVTKCKGILSNDTSRVCSGQGRCWPYDTCTCNNLHYFGDGDCDKTHCYGVYMDSPDVCSGKGKCWPYNICNCTERYFGKKCEVTTCDGLYTNDTNACSSHGHCFPENTCQCSANWFGLNSYCNITTCQGYFSNGTDPLICKGRGNCILHNKCDCHNKTAYFGDDCEITLCFEIFSNQSQKVCNGHGICWPYGKCNCSEKAGYFGRQCLEFIQPDRIVEFNVNSSYLFFPYRVPVNILFLFNGTTTSRRTSFFDRRLIVDKSEFPCGERLKNWEYYRGDRIKNWKPAKCWWIINSTDTGFTAGIKYQLNYDSIVYDPVPDNQKIYYNFELELITEQKNETYVLVRSGNLVVPDRPKKPDPAGPNVGGIIGGVVGGLAAGLLAAIVLGGICSACILCCVLFLVLILFFIVGVLIAFVFGCGTCVVVFLVGGVVVVGGGGGAATAGVATKVVVEEVTKEEKDVVTEHYKAKMENKKQDVELDLIGEGSEESDDTLLGMVQDDGIDEKEGLDLGMVQSEGSEEDSDGFGIELSGVNVVEEEEKIGYVDPVDEQKEKDLLKIQKKEEKLDKKEEKIRLKKDKIEEESSLQLDTKFARKKKKKKEKKLKKEEKKIEKERKKLKAKAEKIETGAMDLKSWEKKKEKEREKNKQDSSSSSSDEESD